MSRACLEAMACERLLIASDIPAAREIVDEGVNGLLFRLGDVEHLAARTVEAAADPAMREAIGRRARAGVSHMSVDGVVPSYLHEFREAMATAAAWRRFRLDEHGAGL
jgi:glycosyltransferase involved in cell wall biosynthesis